MKGLQQGGASTDDVIAAKSRYLNTLHQYQNFSKKMKLPEQMERVYMDGLGRVAVSYTHLDVYKRKVLWDQIQIAYAAIIRAQRIMYVKNAEDKTIEKVEEKSGNRYGERWEVQQAWDKQANFLNAQARAQKTLDQMINRYEDLLHKNWELATKEQKARIRQLRANTKKLCYDLIDNDRCV